MHSLSDLASDALVLATARSAGRAPDTAHPYGHARFETAATVAIGVILLAVAGGFAHDAVVRLLEPGQGPAPGGLVLVTALAAVLAKELVYRYTVRAGRRSGSALIVANAWHHRSDALSSLVVIGGALGAMAGLAWPDAVAALLVALMVGAMGWSFAWNATRELVDTGTHADTLRDLHATIDAVEGVRAHHRLRTRYLGGWPMVDVHVVVAPDISVARGHGIGAAVRDAVDERLGGSAEVLVHLDPDRETRSRNRSWTASTARLETVELRGPFQATRAGGSGIPGHGM